MPHKCTNCEATFPDGSKEMLSGCPHCGGNTFQYIPETADAGTTATDEPPDPPLSENVAGRVGQAASTVKEYVSERGKADAEREGTDSPGTEPAAPEDEATTEAAGPAETEPPEDSAQASARGEVADLSELSTESAAPNTDSDADDGRVLEEPDSAADTDLETLRAELNDQFESIRIVEPGQYELNLMELYDREEHIVALREDGKYVIEVPETWRED